MNGRHMDSNVNLRTTLAAAMLAGVLAAGAGGIANAGELPMSPTLISDVAEKVTPAVVNVLTKSKAEQVSLPFEHPMFRDLFGGDPRRGGARPMERGAGSGVLITNNGYIVTNNH